MANANSAIAMAPLVWPKPRSMQSSTTKPLIAAMPMPARPPPMPGLTEPGGSSCRRPSCSTGSGAAGSRLTTRAPIAGGIAASAQTALNPPSSCAIWPSGGPIVKPLQTHRPYRPMARPRRSGETMPTTHTRPPVYTQASAAPCRNRAGRSVAAEPASG